MRVKVGHKWFEVSPGQPLMVELTERDRANIVNMAPGASCYAVFDDLDAEEWSKEEKLAWMEAGRK